MHNINTFKSPNVSHLMKSHTLSFQGRYREAPSFSWKAFTFFLGTCKDYKTRCRRGHNLSFRKYRAFLEKNRMVPVGSFNTSLAFWKEPPNSSVNSFESLFPGLQRDFQSVCSNCPDSELLSWINQKALTEKKCPYTGGDLPCYALSSKHAAFFGDSVFWQKPKSPSGIYFLRKNRLLFDGFTCRLICIAEGILAQRILNLSPPLSRSHSLFIEPPDGYLFARNIHQGERLESNIIGQKNNALHFTIMDPGKCVFSGTFKRPQRFKGFKHSLYGSNTKRKKSRFILKLFNQEHLFEGLSFRNNSPCHSPQLKWNQGFKLYHTKPERESHKQRSFNFQDSVCPHRVGRANHTNHLHAVP